jgi:hypothetical protein
MRRSSTPTSRAGEFLERVKDVYDDALLVRREDFSDESRDETSAIYGEALELIAYIVGHDRPFTEIGTADYTVANALFQRDADRMPFPMEPVVGNAWQPTHYTDGRPHAGLLSTSAFYEVWDTNNTNKNRRRANRWSILFHCYNFLDTPVDVTRDVDNNDDGAVLEAVTTRTDCKACHDRLDPLASFLFPMDNVQRLEDTGPDDFFSGDPERWRRANKRPPAGLRRAGNGHPRPRPHADAASEVRRVPDQARLQDALPARPQDHRGARHGGRSRGALGCRGQLQLPRPGPPLDAVGRLQEPSGERRSGLGAARVAGALRAHGEGPDRLRVDARGRRRPGRRDPGSDPPRTAPVPLLTSEEDGYKIIFGGINGVSVSGRSNSLNASVAMVQRKIAALAADFVVFNDLAVPDEQRRLLRGVRGDESPTVDEAAIRAAIARIARRLYGTALATNSPQVDAWMQLYRALYGDTTQAQAVPGTAGERAWRGLPGRHAAQPANRSLLEGHANAPTVRRRAHPPLAPAARSLRGRARGHAVAVPRHRGGRRRAALPRHLLL